MSFGHSLSHTSKLSRQLLSVDMSTRGMHGRLAKDERRKALVVGVSAWKQERVS